MESRARRGVGLTLIETIVVIFVFSILLLTIIKLLQGGIAAWKKGSTQTSLRAGVRKALDDVTADLRTLVYLKSPPPGLPVGTIQTVGAAVTYFTFNRAVANAGASPPYTEVNTTYTIDNATSTLQRTENGVTVVVAENIVCTDPRAGQTNPRSFFQSYDDKGSKVYVQLCSVDGVTASPLTSNLATVPAEMTLGTTVVCFNYQRNEELQAYAAVRAVAPAALGSPGRSFRRAPLDVPR